MKNNIIIYFLLLSLSIFVDAKDLYSSLNENTKDSISNLENYLNKNGYSFTKKSEKTFTIYFDTPELILYTQDLHISYNAIAYLSKKKKKEKYKETITYKDKKGILNSFKVKHYNSVKTLEGKHPLLHIIKRNQRKLFIEKLNANNIIYPLQLKSIMEVSKIIQSYSIVKNNKILATIHLNKVQINTLNHKINTNILHIESGYNITLKDKLFSLFQIIPTEINNTEYIFLFDILKHKINFILYILKYPYLITLMYSFIFLLFGLIFIFIFFRKRFYSK
jgi:hypothetical protein